MTLPALRGLHHLRRLLEQPGQDVPSADLAAAAAGHAGVAVRETSTGEVVDDVALAAYRDRLADLDAELAEADRWADSGRANRLSVERELILAEVRSATGLGGRRRRFGTAQERARVAVRKSLAAAIDRIADADEGLARRLRDDVRTGALCRYDPDPARPVTWVLGPPGPAG